jgi:hypothetical protein
VADHPFYAGFIFQDGQVGNKYGDNPKKLIKIIAMSRLTQIFQFKSKANSRILQSGIY